MSLWEDIRGSLREGGSTGTGGGLAAAGLMKSCLWSHTETTMLLEDSRRHFSA